MSEVRTNGDPGQAAKAAPHAPGRLRLFLIGLLIGLPAGAGLAAAALWAHPGGAAELAPGAVGVRTVPPPRLSLPEFVEIIELLPPDAPARARLREIADPLVRATGRGTTDDVLYLGRRDVDDMCRLLPAGDAQTKFTSVLGAGGPAPGVVSYEKWSAECAPYLGDFPPELAFLRALPKPQADGVFLPGGDRGEAFSRAVWYARRARDLPPPPSIEVPPPPSMDVPPPPGMDVPPPSVRPTPSGPAR